ncbi:MAG: Sec-independent protein translocase protein TatC [Actinomycetota bacterium]|jgi:sec-independent protein translocase protein TatC
MALRSKKRRVRRPDDEATLIEHLGELRFRIIRSLLAVAIGMILVLLQYEPLLRFLTKPYRNLCGERPDFGCDGTLYGLGPLDGLAARMRISVYGGIILALPVIMWQIWRFVAPALHRKEKKYAVGFVASSVVLFALGGYIAYWTLDKALEFLISWSGTDVEQAYQITKYVNLVFTMVLAFGIGFLFPVLLVFLQLVDVITPRQLVMQWRWAIMLIFLTAAVITPSGDPVSLFALSLPMCLLYGVSVGIGYTVAWRRRRHARAAS